MTAAIDKTTELEKLKSNLALQNETILITDRSVVEYAQIAIRGAILANGVAATAILSFLGQSHDKTPFHSDRLILAAIIAAFGTLCGFLATVFAYFSQWGHLKAISLSDKATLPGARWERIAGIVCVLMGIAAFTTAIICAATAFYR